MRDNLKAYRVRKRLNQAQVAAAIGCTRQTYAAIEAGTRDGRQTFWNDLQKALDVPDADMWALQKNDE